MIIRFSDNFLKQSKKLAPELKKKLKKQLYFLGENYRHPSLQTEKMGGTGIYEARLDDHYRFRYTVSGDEATVISVGPHDVGLGKK